MNTELPKWRAEALRVANVTRWLFLVMIAFILLIPERFVIERLLIATALVMIYFGPFIVLRSFIVDGFAAKNIARSIGRGLDGLLGTFQIFAFAGAFFTLISLSGGPQWVSFSPVKDAPLATAILVGVGVLITAIRWVARKVWSDPSLWRWDN